MAFGAGYSLKRRSSMHRLAADNDTDFELFYLDGNESLSNYQKRWVFEIAWEVVNKVKKVAECALENVCPVQVGARHAHRARCGQYAMCATAVKVKVKKQEEKSIERL